MISGKLVTLRAVEASDIANWLIWFNDTEVTQYLARIYPYSQTDAENYLRRVQQNASDLLYSIFTKEETEHIGSINLSKIDWRSRNAELGVLIGIKKYWGKSYGQDAVRTLCHFAFSEMGLNRVYLYVRADHEAGCRAYSKIGFRQEGIARQQLYRNGSFHDLILMGLLSGDLLL